MNKSNREKDRQSGTGRPIKGEDKRGGGGKGNWGSVEDQIHQAVDQHENKAEDQQKAKKRKEPQGMSELNESQPVSEPKKAFDEFLQGSGRTKASPYNGHTVNSSYHSKKMKLKSSQKETNKLFEGTQNKKKKKQKKKKPKNVLGNVSFTYVDLEGEKSGDIDGVDAIQGGRGQGRGPYGDFGWGRGARGRGAGGFGARGRGIRPFINDNNNNNNDDDMNVENVDIVPHEQQQQGRRQPTYRVKQQNNNADDANQSPNGIQNS